MSDGKEAPEISLGLRWVARFLEEESSRVRVSETGGLYVLLILMAILVCITLLR